MPVPSLLRLALRCITFHQWYLVVLVSHVATVSGQALEIYWLNLHTVHWHELVLCGQTPFHTEGRVLGHGHRAVSGVSHGLGLGLGFSHIVELCFFCVWRVLVCCWDDVRSSIVQLWLYFIHGLISEISHGLGWGLGLSHTEELWFWCLQGPSLSLGGC